MEKILKNDKIKNMNYVFGILIDFASKIIISVANIFDGQLSRKTFTSVWALVTLNGLLLIPVLPIMFFILKPTLVTLPQFFLIFVIASIEFFYQIPYYKALREADTSVVASLFNFEKIFVPVLAYFIVAERLATMQYIGFAIIIGCSFILTFNKSSLKFSKAVWYMIPVVIILALESVLQKYGLDQVEWKTFYFWSLALTLPFYISTLFISRTVQKEVSIFFKSPFSKSYIPLYGQNIATWISGGLGTLALSILPVTITKAIGSFHALIVHLIASKGSKGLQVDGEKLSQKRIFVFIIIAIGVFLTLKR